MSVSTFWRCSLAAIVAAVYLVSRVARRVTGWKLDQTCHTIAPLVSADQALDRQSSLAHSGIATQHQLPCLQHHLQQGGQEAHLCQLEAWSSQCIVREDWGLNSLVLTYYLFQLEQIKPFQELASSNAYDS